MEHTEKKLEAMPRISPSSQICCHALNADQRRNINFEKLFGARARALPVQPPVTAIGENTPADAPLRGDFRGGKVTQNLVGWRAGIELVSGVAAVERSHPAICLKDQNSMAIAPGRPFFP